LLACYKERERDILARVVVCALVFAVLAIGTIKELERAFDVLPFLDGA
jgi:hypothetical protein